jgi:hypothetical protein
MPSDSQQILCSGSPQLFDSPFLKPYYAAVAHAPGAGNHPAAHLLMSGQPGGAIGSFLPLPSRSSSA